MTRVATVLAAACLALTPLAPAAQTTGAAGSQATSAVEAEGALRVMPASSPAPAERASNWIGQPVYSATDERIGDVKDLLLGEDYRVTAAVIGVGGFLGIGQTSVLVPIDRLKPQAAEGEVTLFSDVTRDQLEAAIGAGDGGGER